MISRTKIIDAFALVVIVAALWLVFTVVNLTYILEVMWLLPNDNYRATFLGLWFLAPVAVAAVIGYRKG